VLRAVCYVLSARRKHRKKVCLLRGARHPCVELMDGVDFVANSYDLRSGDKEFMLITGPNMGGELVTRYSLCLFLTKSIIIGKVVVFLFNIANSLDK
jgi:hypothetical protein